ncbi:MAG: winged helix-turn-helix transcriptional regulator [Anaerolineae bacterium]|nr:winged helix-turn-helix transcriptional regulator [Anaerolineae bacterium]MCB9108282.1 winged helix-turn-helix transcriptional regulator [Anaerolineales bacterium]
MTNFDMVAFCKALGDETRQRILQILQTEGEKCVSDLVDVFNVSQPTISHHLNFLKQANLVASRRDGKQVYYRANQDNITECCGILFTKLVPTEIELTEFTPAEKALP